MYPNNMEQSICFWGTIYHNLDTEPNCDDGTQHGKEHTLPVTGETPTQSSIQPSNPVVPPSPENRVATDPDEQPRQSRKVEVQEPLPIHIVKDDELSQFERKTVFFGFWSIVIASVSLIAAISAAFFIYQQFKEMASQTNLAGIAARQARVDSKESSKQFQHQLALLQSQVVAASEQNRLVREAARGRVMFTEWRLVQAQAGLPLVSEMKWRNVGHSAIFYSVSQKVERWKGMPKGRMPLKSPNPMSADNLIAENGEATSVMTDGVGVDITYLNGLPKTFKTDLLAQFQTTYFFGKIAYITDGVQHTYEFCAYVVDDQIFREAAGKGFSVQGQLPVGRYQLRQCPKWHGEDQKDEKPN